MLWGKITINTLSFIEQYAPHKSGSKRSLAEKARSLGLEPLALKLLNSTDNIDWNSAVKRDEGCDLKQYNSCTIEL